MTRDYFFYALFFLFGLWVFAPSAHASDLYINTEEYPPYNYTNKTGQLDGFSTRIVQEMLARAGMNATIKSKPWSKALNEAKDKSRYCVYSTTRTPEREQLFNWVGPLVTNSFAAFRAASRDDLHAHSLLDLKGLKIGGYVGDAATAHIKRKGLSVIESLKDEENVTKIKNREIDVWVGGKYTLPLLAKKNGVKLIELFTFNQSIMSLACNITIDAAIISKLQDVLDDMKADGSYGKLLHAPAVRSY